MFYSRKRERMRRCEKKVLEEYMKTECDERERERETALIVINA